MIPNINNLEEIVNFVGTRGEIYDLIHRYNPLAIIDKRQARVNIGDDRYIIILKKVGNAYKIRVIWDLDTNEQYYF